MQKSLVAKRVAAVIFALPSLLLGFGVLFLAAGSFLTPGTQVTRNSVSFALSLILSCLYVFLGIVGLRFGIIGVGKLRAGVKWWRIALGAAIIIVETQSRIAPAPRPFTADNPAQAGGMMVAAVLIYCVGLWLIIAGIRAKYIRLPESASPGTSQSQ